MRIDVMTLFPEACDAMMSESIIGRARRDGKLTVRDATALQKYVAGMVGLNTQDKINADFNEDGKINVRDATAIQKRIAKIS